MVDFSIPPDLLAMKNRTREFVEQVVLPCETQIEERGFENVVEDLQTKAKAAGLWNPSLPEEWGGMGLGTLGTALVMYELGASRLGPIALNCHAPDEPTMHMILRHGTQDQRDKYLRSLSEFRAHVCFSMTEKAAGADATGMQTKATREGDTWVLNGEKWYSSGAGWATFAVVMAKTDPDAPRHKQFSTFFVDLPNPGWDLKRLIPTMGSEDGEERMGGHGEIEIRDCVIPRENMLGQRGEGFALGQFRLGLGRLAHGMRNIGLAQRALDIAMDRALSRETFGKPLADRQGVQWMLADSAMELYIARLMILHIAYLVENHCDFLQENSMAKIYVSEMVSGIVDRAIQVCGSLGYSKDLPLESWYRHTRAQRIVDGPNEVHKWTIARNLIKSFKETGSTRSATGDFAG